MPMMALHFNSHAQFHMANTVILLFYLCFMSVLFVINEDTFISCLILLYDTGGKTPKHEMKKNKISI